jgi:hypothetical protein
MKSHINILPLQFRKKLLVRQIVPSWACVWGGVAVMAAIICWNADATLADAQAAFAIVDVRAEPLRQIVQRNQQATEDLKVADQRQLLADCLNAADKPLQLVGLISSTANTNDGSIQIQSFQLTQGEQPTKSASAATAENNAPHRMKLGLQGYAVDDLALSRFVSQLRATGVFESVELQTSSNVQLAAGSARQYVVECQF